MEDFKKIWQRNCSSSSSNAKDVIRPLVEDNCSEFVLAHARRELRPARQFTEVCLLPHILERMRKLGLDKLLRLQSYTWPHLAGGAEQGAMIVGASGSGRTLAYMPPVCHAVFKAITESMSQLKDLEPGAWPQGQLGPIALILVPDLGRVRQVSDLCHALLPRAFNEECFTLTLNVPSTKSSEFFLRLLNGVGCLVTTPTQLVWLWQEAPCLRRFSDLQFLVYDDVDLMSADQLEGVQKVLRKIMPLTHSPQVVMVSQSYSSTLMAKLRALNGNPALVIGDIMEAALYGGTRMNVSLVRSSAKVNAVVQLLRQRPPHEYRTVIHCVDDWHMQRLEKALRDQAYNCQPYYQNSNLPALQQVPNSRGVILLCTDNCKELSIRDAHTLIHYSMSDSWSKFKMRHLMLSGNLSNSLAAKANPVKVPLHSLVLLDENNHQELPLLVDFVQLHQEVDPGVVAVAKRIRQEMDKAKSDQQALCSQILVLGKCYDPVCQDRHNVSHLDRRPDHIPASGDVKVQLVKVYSPTHFCVRLLEHMPLQGSWQTLPHPEVQEIRMLHKLEMASTHYWPPVVGAICIYQSTIAKERVRVLAVATIQNVNIVQSDLPVKVQAVDVDTRIFSTTCGLLFQCPESVQREPPLASDLRLLGLVPYTGERSWTEEDGRNVKLMLTQLPKDYFLQSKIQFATAGTLYVRDLVAIVYEDQLDVHLPRLNLAEELVKTTLAKRCEKAANMILNFFGEVFIEKDIGEKEEKDVLEQKLLETKPTIEDASNNQTAKPSVKTKEGAGPKSKKEPIAVLNECFVNCALLQKGDPTSSSRQDSTQAGIDPVNQAQTQSPIPHMVVRPLIYHQNTTTWEFDLYVIGGDYDFGYLNEDSDESEDEDSDESEDEEQNLDDIDR
ncbi:putative ATP-dependent RNA helicase BoYb [Drosophila gunungcola]|uniref:RNA helicase n=1 Tax=Drosophila gunungcola TaxID=103775 RepID=A0A9Q0BKC9_9MUSC|nr:putative ATP-dependent RNA helicase BoYb [Drosophila gunungcola]KAI8034820.1 hypothetical protein M5D96_012336 [Drosophila gunungcola]